MAEVNVNERKGPGQAIVASDEKIAAPHLSPRRGGSTPPVARYAPSRVTA